jgi:hypothetical protein
MVNGQFQLLGSSTGINDARHLADVNCSGALLVDIMDGTPIEGNNPKWSFVYDESGNIGSIYQMIDIGSYINTITWVGYSGTSIGVGSRVTNISEWSAI